MEPLRRAIRHAFNTIDPADLHDVTGDPEEYQVEVDYLMYHLRITPPGSPKALIHLVHQILCYTLRPSLPVGFVLADDSHPEPLREPSEDGLHLLDLRACYPPTDKEHRLGWAIWTLLETQQGRS